MQLSQVAAHWRIANNASMAIISSRGPLQSRGQCVVRHYLKSRPTTEPQTMRCSPLYLLADRARTVIVQRFFDRKTGDLDPAQIRGADAHSLAEFERIVAADEGLRAAIGLRI